MNLTPIKNTGVSIRPVVFGTSAPGNLYQAIFDNTLFEIILSLKSKFKVRREGTDNSQFFHSGFLAVTNYFDYRLIKPNTFENRKLFDWRERFFTICRRFQEKSAETCVRFARSAPGVVSISWNNSKLLLTQQNIASVSAGIHLYFWDEMKIPGLISRDYTYL